MEKLEGYNSRINRLSELVALLESGKLGLDELSEMETITRELHERSIILRYNAFKNQVLPEQDVSEGIVDEDGGVEVEVIIEEIEEEVEELEEDPTIDFSIFDDSDEEEAKTSDSDPIDIGSTEDNTNGIVDEDGGVEVEVIIEEIQEEPEPEIVIEPEPEEVSASDIDPIAIESTDDSAEDIVEEPAPVIEAVVEPEPEVVEPEPEVIEAEPEVKTDEPVVESAGGMTAQAFLDKLSKVNDNSLASRFTSSKLDSLIGAFGLNQRLRYINDLFDGSSEMFSDAIKSLDNQSKLDEARMKAGTLAIEHGWDPEEEIVIEFMSYVNRRYA